MGLRSSRNTNEIQAPNSRTKKIGTKAPILLLIRGMIEILRDIYIINEGPTLCFKYYGISSL